LLAAVLVVGMLAVVVAQEVIELLLEHQVVELPQKQN
jgi:hypothetical protein